MQKLCNSETLLGDLVRCDRSLKDDNNLLEGALLLLRRSSEKNRVNKQTGWSSSEINYKRRKSGSRQAARGLF